MPSSLARDEKSISSASSRADTISRTASAPIMRASQMSRASTVKSLRSRGRSQPMPAALRSAAEPPKYCWSVSTEMQAAPPSAYELASASGSSVRRRFPLEGERRFISAMTAPLLAPASALARRKAASKPLVGGHARASSFRCSKARSS